MNPWYDLTHRSDPYVPDLGFHVGVDACARLSKTAFHVAVQSLFPPGTFYASKVGGGVTSGVTSHQYPVPRGGAVAVSSWDVLRLQGMGRCKLIPGRTRVAHAWFQRLKLTYDEPRSKFAFNFNVRPYTWARARGAPSRA